MMSRHKRLQNYYFTVKVIHLKNSKSCPKVVEKIEGIRWVVLIANKEGIVVICTLKCIGDNIMIGR